MSPEGGTLPQLSDPGQQALRGKREGLKSRLVLLRTKSRSLHPLAHTMKMIFRATELLHRFCPCSRHPFRGHLLFGSGYIRVYVGL